MQALQRKCKPEYQQMPKATHDTPTILTITADEHRFYTLDADQRQAPMHLLLKGVSDAALEKRVSAPIEFMDQAQSRRLRQKRHQPPAMQMGMIDGVIAMGMYVEDILDALGHRLPTVTVTRSVRPRDLDSAGPEHLHSVERLVRYLHQLGHDSIGFISIDERPSWAIERYSGYLYAMNSLGLTIDTASVLNVTGPQFDDQKLAEPIVKQTRAGVTAWVCVSDGLAREVYMHLQEAGIKTPDDVSIVGFDGVRALPDCPPLTTIRVPWETIGKGAMAAMLDRISEPGGAPVHRSYIGSFVEGKTTAPPPKRR